MPEGMDELFDLVRIDKTSKVYDNWLDEKKRGLRKTGRIPTLEHEGIQIILYYRIFQ